MGGDCGLHIHISKKYLSEVQQALLDYFVNKHSDFFVKIARRNSDRWASFKKDGDGKKYYGKACGSRYMALNFENRETIEFRLFRGTLKYKTFIGTIQLVAGLAKFIKTIKTVDFIKCDTLEMFYEYLQNKTEYIDAINYINKRTNRQTNEQTGE